MTQSAASTDRNEKTQLLRLLYMLLFGAVLYFALIILIFVVLVQFAFALFGGATNTGIRNFSRDLSHYIYQISLYLTYNEERLPYPFNPLYDEVVDAEPEQAVAAEYQDLPDHDADADNSEKPQG